MSGIERIAAERQRQIDGEGWTDEHDDRHDDGSLAVAAATYAMPDPGWRTFVRDPESWEIVPEGWPFDFDWWKPTPDDRIRELEKAGALIAAEIDRIERMEAAAAAWREKRGMS